VRDIAVVAPVDERLQRRSEIGLLAHAPALAVHVAAAPLTWTDHARLPCTLKLTEAGVAMPAATSMSDIVAVTEIGERGDDVGETVNLSSAGFVIVPGLARLTSGEHFPV
jgi:hypothetical protein